MAGVNAVLFVCIVLVLMQKLNASISVETRRYRYRKLARSTLVLIPLFGFHYVLFVGLSAFMNVNPIVELIWLFVDQLFASFQGCFVAILYCFMSSEVKLELKKHWAILSVAEPIKESAALLVRYDGLSGGSVHIEAAPLNGTSDGSPPRA
ncbi:parathyroid hormone/parathyroid hormone-related peptide receptor-like [Pollicipes pollicipes]|uniref:parathyroid hormone/parathyroid hormone-related peptide receptor-like n=1 Tax=Pollicipes pollicipes TaxID=41117 RepID=UPI001885692A|nr:parathyroid hormone/parathyroid hormone-related peptide receptor-like [Pollicipes pollicipes]